MADIALHNMETTMEMNSPDLVTIVIVGVISVICFAAVVSARKSPVLVEEESRSDSVLCDTSVTLAGTIVDTS